MKAVFVFSHSMLFRAWDTACERLQEQGIEAVVVSQMSAVDWDEFAAREVGGADAVYLNLSRHFPSFETLVRSAQKVRLAIAAGIETESELPACDPAWRETIDQYLKAGGIDDLANAAKFLLYRAGCLNEAPGLPAEPILCGVLDLDSNRLFDTTTDYFAYQNSNGNKLNGKPITALCFGRSLWLDGDLALPHAAIRALEERGFTALPIFCDWELATSFGRASEHPLDQILKHCGDRLTLIWNGLFSHTGQTDDSGGPFSTMVNTAFAWSATSRVVTKAQFDGICRVYIENKKNREWLARDNIYALEEITRRLLEAHSRGLWLADPDQIEAVQQTVLSLEGDLEERMGPVSGEFQGGSVDILTREKVDAWNYRYRVK
ncbi:MAG: cobaltochelatase subunit CobN [Deltaproteobacteria bacterium]|nr:cobaltochelatase subunit CobN [Deltaproteobacteria bacterium]